MVENKKVLIIDSGDYIKEERIVADYVKNKRVSDGGTLSSIFLTPIGYGKNEHYYTVTRIVESCLKQISKEEFNSLFEEQDLVTIISNSNNARLGVEVLLNHIPENLNSDKIAKLVFSLDDFTHATEEEIVACKEKLTKLGYEPTKDITKYQKILKAKSAYIRNAVHMEDNHETRTDSN